jgi:hypothetical protein
MLDVAYSSPVGACPASILSREGGHGKRNGLPVSAVAADVALSRCAPSGPRSLTTVVRPTSRYLVRRRTSGRPAGSEWMLLVGVSGSPGRCILHPVRRDHRPKSSPSRSLGASPTGVIASRGFFRSETWRTIASCLVACAQAASCTFGSLRGGLSRAVALFGARPGGSSRAALLAAPKAPAWPSGSRPARSGRAPKVIGACCSVRTTDEDCDLLRSKEKRPTGC